jgi:hypothetical protein
MWKNLTQASNHMESLPFWGIVAMFLRHLNWERTSIYDA